MADPIIHALTEANSHIKSTAGDGKKLKIDRFNAKSLILIVGGAGSYDVQVSNTGNDGAAGDWVDIATGLVAGASPHLITTEHGAMNRFPDCVGYMRVVTNTFNAGDRGNFLGSDDH